MGGNVLLRNALRPFLMSVNPCGVEGHPNAHGGRLSATPMQRMATPVVGDDVLGKPQCHFHTDGGTTAVGKCPGGFSVAKESELEEPPLHSSPYH